MTMYVLKFTRVTTLCSHLGLIASEVIPEDLVKIGDEFQNYNKQYSSSIGRCVCEPFIV